MTAVGAGVSGIAAGDRVAGCFFQNWAAGEVSAAAMASAQGGALDGVLAEEVVLDADGVVPIPAHLDHADAATLPCAAVTAWHALVEKGGLKAGDTVLLLGTGGVSIFALQFCTLTGARAIVTSKSDGKLARARAMGAWRTINYAETPDWAAAVKDFTGGAGVDHVVEVGGGGTLAQSIEAVRIGGHVAMIGVLTPGHGRSDADPAQVDPPERSLRRQPGHVPRHERRDRSRRAETGDRPPLRLRGRPGRLPLHGSGRPLRQDRHRVLARLSHHGHGRRGGRAAKRRTTG